MVKNKSAKQTEEATKLVKTASIVVGMFMVAIIIVLIIIGVRDSSLKDKYSQVLDWNSLSVEADAVNKEVTPMEGTISLVDYIEFRHKDSFEGLAKISGILPDSIVGNITDGIESKYYEDSVKADYKELCESITSMVKQCEYVNKLYNAYQNDIGIEDINYCLEYGSGSSEKCDLYDYFVSYSTGVLKDYFIDSHNKYEAVCYYYSQKEQLDESYLDLFYQNEICTNMEYLKKVNVEVIVLNNDTYNLGLEEVQKAKDSKLLMVENYNENMGYYLSQLNLYRDIDFYDGDMVELANKTVSSLFTADVVDEGSMQTIGQNLSQEDLKEQLKGIEATPSEVKVEALEIEGYQVLEYSLTGRDEKDIYYIMYKVKESEHDMSIIPTQEEMTDELTMKGKAMMAQKKVSEIIMAEVEDLDLSDEESVANSIHLHEGDEFTEETAGSQNAED